MTKPTGLITLEQAKAARNGAHGAFQTRLVQVREDLAARSVGGRVADRANEVIAHGVDVARENKAVVAGTIAALALWFLRGPIIAAIGGLWGDEDEVDDTPERTADDE